VITLSNVVIGKEDKFMDRKRKRKKSSRGGMKRSKLHRQEKLEVL
jgi:hypothetical protein